MQTVFAWVALAGSLLGMISSIVARVPERQAVGSPRASLWLPSLVTLALFGLSRLTAGPFSSGGTLGPGVLIGGLLGWIVARIDDSRAPLPTLPFAAAGAGPAAILLLFRGYPNEALIGCALGAVVFTAVAVRSTSAAGGEDEARPETRPARLDWYALAAIASCAGARAAIDQFHHASPGDIAGAYWVLPAVLLALGALIFALSDLSPEADHLSAAARAAASGWGPGSMAILGAVATALLLRSRLMPGLDPRPLIEGALGIWLLGVVAGSVRDADAPGPVVAGLVLWIALLGIGFGQLHAFGLALFLISALMAASVRYGAASNEAGRHETLVGGAVTLGLLFLLNRLFLDRAGAGHGLDFQRYLDLTTILGGTMVALFGTWREPARTARLLAAQRLLDAAAAAGLPLLFATLWGSRAAGSYFVGIMTGELVWTVLGCSLNGRAGDTIRARPPHVLILLSAVSAVQLTPLAVSLTPTRGLKLGLLALLGFFALAWLVLDASRATGRKRLDESAA